jgi:hypothetical protein
MRVFIGCIEVSGGFFQHTFIGRMHLSRVLAHRLAD